MALPTRNNLGHFPHWHWEDEARIIDAVITAAFERGYRITVNDGEEDVVRKSNDREAIQKQCGQTDETYLVLFSPENKRLGFMWFVHGNRADVLTDHTANEAMDELAKAVEPLVAMLGNN